MTAHLRVTLVAPTADFLQIILHHAFLPVHQSTIERFGGIDVRRFRVEHSRRLSWETVPFSINGMAARIQWISVERNPYRLGGFFFFAPTVRLDGIRLASPDR